MSSGGTSSVDPHKDFTAPRSRKLHDTAVRYLPGGTSRFLHDTYPHPLYVTKGSGFIVVDVDGQERIDFANNATSLVHGHAHPAVTRRVVERVHRGTAFSLCSAEQIDLARLLTERVSSVETVRFTNSGSEAVLYAIKAMRAVTGRHKIAKFEGCYNGNADWAEVSLSPSPAEWGSRDRPNSVPYTAGTPPSVLSDVVVLQYNDPDQVESQLRHHRDALAGVLVDVMPARIGLVPAGREWLDHLRAITSELGLLLVSDEVINFRLAYGGAQEVYDFDADLTTFGKIVGGGFPVGAVGGREDVMRAFVSADGHPKVPHGGTFNANPVTMAAGVATLELLTRAEIERINALGQRLRSGVSDIIDELAIPAHVTGAGSLFRIHLTDRRFSDYRGAWEAVLGAPDVLRRHRQLYTSLLDKGILYGELGVGAVSTPMAEEEIDLFLEAVRPSLAEIDFTG